MIPRHAITVRRWSAGPADAHGVQADVWTNETVNVFAISPATEETLGEYRQADSETVTIYAPAGVQVAARDRIVWQSHTYEVLGDSIDWTNGPWQNSAAGVVVRARRVDG